VLASLSVSPVAWPNCTQVSYPSDARCGLDENTKEELARIYELIRQLDDAVRYLASRVAFLERKKG